jgi:hypothetical protein
VLGHERLELCPQVEDGLSAAVLGVDTIDPIAVRRFSVPQRRSSPEGVT